MSGRYARTTSVTVSQSRVELEGILERYGADAFGYATDKGRVDIAFRIDGRHVRMTVPMPLITDDEFQTTWTGRLAAESTVKSQWEQACRSRWRALVLVVKAKLEAVAVGISTVEREFLADIMLPDGRTIGATIAPQIAESYRTGNMPPLLSGPTTPALPAGRGSE